MSFIFNRWVRGRDFYGRRILLRTVRDRELKPTWILGNRRVGKTSFLRQIEWLCRNGEWTGAAPLYWDLQGAGSPDGLKDSFLEALEDADALTERLGLDLDALEDAPFTEIINKFRRKAKAIDDHLLLLIDECEELVDITSEDASILATFRKLNHTRGISLIMAGSMRLMDLDESSSRTSPFLPDFLPPLLLGPFLQEESVNLLMKNGLEEEVSHEIHNLTLGNPHLTQVIGEHFSRLGDMDQALTELKRDKVLYYFYNSNFNCLPDEYRDWWLEKQAYANLSDMSPSDPNFPYMVQSALVRIGDQGQVETSPLLRMTEENAVPERAQAKPAASSGPKQNHTQYNVLNAFHKRNSPLGVIPSEVFESGDLSHIIDAQDPPSLNMIANLDEPDEKLHDILNGASPEYVLGKQTGDRTHVYLAGVYLHKKLFNSFLFNDIDDPWDRAGAIADQDVVVTPEAMTQARLSPIQAMALMRALKADPEQRYACLDDFMQDLKAG